MNEDIHLKEHDDGMYHPSDSLSLLMLQHCSGGLVAVTPDFWSSHVKSMAELHGWGWEIETKS